MSSKIVQGKELLWYDEYLEFCIELEENRVNTPDYYIVELINGIYMYDYVYNDTTQTFDKKYIKTYKSHSVFYTKDNVNDLIDSCITKISSTATKLPMQRNGKDVYSKEIDIPYLTNTIDLELTSDEKSRVDEIWIDFQNSYAMSGKYATGITRVKVEGTTHNLDWFIDTETFNLNLETLIAPENSGDVIVKVVVLYTLNPLTP